MSSATSTHRDVTFRVLDAMDAPHTGRILRLRLQSGEAPTIKSLKGAAMRAVSPDGEATCTFRVLGFALFGGKPSNERLARTGRIDVHIEEDAGGPIGLRWEVRP